jgi:hypothetical protein
MVARMVLPALGGSPAVWTTCMVFFQSALLAGYAYAHVLTKQTGRTGGPLLHIVVILAASVLLPLTIENPSLSSSETPTRWLLATMTISLGPPFFALAASAPLLQRWFSGTNVAAAPDPYWLYAASNAGSLTALLLYPTAVEPLMPLDLQRRWWTAGYALTAVLLVGCAIASRRAPPGPPVVRNSAASNVVRWPRKLRWFLLSLAPSSLMLGVTAHISTDLAAVPLLWVVPLALYLLTFILTFGGAGAVVTIWGRVVLPLTLLPLLMLLVSKASAPIWIMLPLHLVVFFTLTLLCHWELAKDRPPPELLTTFYFWMAFGGMTGGLFNSVVAPLIFTDISEYPLFLAATCLALASPLSLKTLARSPRQWITPAVVGGSAAAVIFMGRQLDLDPPMLFPLLGPIVLLCFSMSRQAAQFGLAVSMFLAAGFLFPATGYGDVVYAERTFFGVYRVSIDHARTRVSLFHGTTLHGSASLQESRPEPLTYYHKESAVADVLARRANLGSSSVGVIGLGVGSLAAYAFPGEKWTFFELDPAVERLARDTRFFRFLEACGETCGVVIGDGRVSLSRGSPRFSVLVIDAFSSDAIPVHLLTREAMRVYLSRLEDNGLLAFHISNRHFDLRPVLAGIASAEGLSAMVRQDQPDEQQSARGYSPSIWVVIARRAEYVSDLAHDKRWAMLNRTSGRVWTDDFSNPWSVLRLR